MAGSDTDGGRRPSGIPLALRVALAMLAVAASFAAGDKLASTPIAHAVTDGPDIVISAPANAVDTAPYQVTVGTADPGGFDPYAGVQVVIVYDSSVADVTGIDTAAASAVFASPLCVSDLNPSLNSSLTPPLKAVTFACASSTGTSGVGTIGVVSVTPLATGLSPFHMVAHGYPDSGGDPWGTYTVDEFSFGAQTNGFLCTNVCGPFAGYSQSQPWTVGVEVVPSTFTVDDTGDAGDDDLDDHICQTAGSVCTLRAAIEQANYTPLAQTIEFSIGSGVQTISPTGTELKITEAVTIDGTTQPGYAGSPIIEVDGTSMADNIFAVEPGADGVTIRGLAVYGTGADVAFNIEGDDGVLEGNYVGTDATGSVNLAPSVATVRIYGDNTRIGGANPIANDGNVIVGALLAGRALRIIGSDTKIQGNYIGLNAAGTASLPGAVGIDDSGAGTLLGGPSAAARNVIAGSTFNYFATSGAVGSRIENNYIGTNATGTAALGGGHGIASFRSNMEIMNNVISGNGSSAIVLYDGTGTQLRRNLIGVAADGTSPLPNLGAGVVVWTSNVVIGGVSGPNTIAHNTAAGVEVDAAVSGVRIQANSIFGNYFPGFSLGIAIASGGNGGILPPTISGFAPNLHGTACANCIVDIYSDDDDQGRIHNGTAYANGSGNWTFTGAVTGPNVTATATNAGGNTSAFSAPAAVTLERVAGTGGAGGFNGDGHVSATLLDKPRGVFKSAAGELHFADSANDRIRKIAGDQVVTVAGGGNPCAGAIGDGCAATQATLNEPSDVFIDAAGNIFIADTFNCRIRKVSAGTNVITTVAGTGTCSFNSDGIAATLAHLNQPYGVAVDGGGNILIADTENCRIRKVDAASGLISTIAGTGVCGFDSDALGATQLNKPRDVYPATGFIVAAYIADTDNNRIRRLYTFGMMDTYAGTGAVCSDPTTPCGDGGNARQAQLTGPESVAVDSRGNVWIADTGNHKVRFVSGASNRIATFAGTGQQGSGGVGGAPDTVALNRPAGVGIGSTAIGDTGGNSIYRAECECDPTGEPTTGYRQTTSCALGSVATTDVMLPFIVLGLLAMRRRTARMLIVLADSIRRAYALSSRLRRPAEARPF